MESTVIARGVWARMQCGCGGAEAVMEVASRDEAVAWAARQVVPEDCENCYRWMEVVESFTIPDPVFRVGAVRESEMKSVLRRDPCSYCGRPCENLDHIVPRSADGDNSTANLTASCRKCNQRKRRKPLLVFMMEAR